MIFTPRGVLICSLDKPRALHVYNIADDSMRGITCTRLAFQPLWALEFAYSRTWTEPRKAHFGVTTNLQL